MSETQSPRRVPAGIPRPSLPVRLEVRHRPYVGGPVYNDVDPEPFETVKAAARSIGRSPVTVYKAVGCGFQLAGRMWAYVGHPLPPVPVKATITKKRAVVSDAGESWESAGECARAMGVSPNTVLRWMGRGRPLAGRLLSKGPDWGGPGHSGWFGGRTLGPRRQAAGAA